MPSILRKFVEMREWHGDACHICGLQMRFTRPKSEISRFTRVTRDHVIPVSCGGGNAASNILLAHQSCNVVRGNHPLTDELRDRCAAIVTALRSNKPWPEIRRQFLRSQATTTNTILQEVK
jgi:hypothetical protein